MNLRWATHLKHRGHELVETLDFAHHDAQQAAVLLIEVLAVADHVDGARDRAQRVADLMCQANRQSTQDRKTLRLVGFVAQLSDLGEILKHEQLTRVVTLDVDQGADRIADRELRPIGATRQTIGAPRALAGSVLVGVHQDRRKRFANQIPAPVVKDLACGRIESENEVFGIRGNEPRRDRPNDVIVEPCQSSGALLSCDEPATGYLKTA